MAEQEIKSKIAEAEDNVCKNDFVVDVTLGSRSGRPAG
jgi:hypothetical protein